MRFEIQSVIHRHDMIFFKWADVGGEYRVYRDHELLYEGTVASFRDGQFKHAKMYHYAIERLEKGEVIEVIALQTSAYAEERTIENPLRFLVFTTIVAKTQIALSWEPIKDVTTYEVYRNGILLREIQSTQYIDRDFSLDTAYTYQIRSQRPMLKSEDKFGKSKFFATALLRYVNRAASQGLPEMDCFTVSKSISNPRGLLKPTSEKSRTRKYDSWQFRYTTFLQEAWIKNPNWFSKNHFFQGDDRDFNVEGESFRTRVDVGLNYANPATSLKLEKKIGTTIAYDRLKKKRTSGVATSEGVTLERTVHKRGETGFILKHIVKNPLMNAPSIDYEVQAILRKDGLVDLTGYHDQAPHHEVYLSKGKEKEWCAIHLAESKGLAWLSGVTSCQYWRFSNFE